MEDAMGDSCSREEVMEDPTGDSCSRDEVVAEDAMGDSCSREGRHRRGVPSAVVVAL